MKYLFGVVWIFTCLTATNLQLAAQKLSPAEQEIFKSEAIKFIQAYYESLPKAAIQGEESVEAETLNDEGETISETISARQKFINRFFDNNDVYVYNDLSPEDQPLAGSQRVMTIDAYLNELQRLYGQKKAEQLKMSLISSSVKIEEIKYNADAVEKFYFAKVQIQRNLQGSYLGKYSTNNNKPIDVYIKTLDKPDTRLQVFKIINTDYESKQIQVGNIGVDEALARGLRFFDEGDFDKAFAYLVKYKDERKLRKNSNATWALGYMYFWGRGTKRSDEEFVNWFTLSADKNNLYALHYLGENYYYGAYGVEEDEDKAFKLIRKSARKGLAVSQYFLGERYEKGQGVKQKTNTAIRWYKKAAKQGYPKAQPALDRIEDKG